MNKTKSWLKTAIAALTILLITAVAFGISGAWYASVKRATGTINLNEGIIIDYSGFGQGSGTWSNNSATFSLFSTDGGLLPGATVSFNETSIKANSSSVDFFARVKLSYKFFTDVEGENEVTSQIVDYSEFLNTPSFANGWVDGNNNGWFYYATGTTFNVFPKSYVNILASGSTLQLNGDAAGFFHEGGGYQYDEFTLIKRIEVVLTLEAYQANQTAAANAGWGISPQYTDAAGVVYTQNANETWTLTDGTALSNNSSSSTATYEARMYDSSYSYTVLSQINNQDVVAIGDNAFLNASQLTEITIPASVSSVGTNAFSGTGLNTITIEKDDAVVSGIETAGIPAASVLNVPGAVVDAYELTNLASGGVEIRGVYPSVGLAYEYNSETQSYTVTGIGTCTDTDIIIPSTYNDGSHGEHNVTSIGELAFSYRSELNSVTIPNSVTSIGGGAFACCYGLTSVIIPSSVTSIERNTFSFCGELISIAIPDSVTSIGSGAFAHCNGLTSIIIPNSVTNIDGTAFMSCSRLTSVIFRGDGRTGNLRVGASVFSNCIELITVIFNGNWTGINVTIDSTAFTGCPVDGNVQLPNQD